MRDPAAKNAAAASPTTTQPAAIPTPSPLSIAVPVKSSAGAQRPWMGRETVPQGAKARRPVNTAAGAARRATRATLRLFSTGVQRPGERSPRGRALSAPVEPKDARSSSARSLLSAMARSDKSAPCDRPSEGPPSASGALPERHTRREPRLDPGGCLTEVKAPRAAFPAADVPKCSGRDRALDVRLVRLGPPGTHEQGNHAPTTKAQDRGGRVASRPRATVMPGVAFLSTSDIARRNPESFTRGTATPCAEAAPPLVRCERRGEATFSDRGCSSRLSGWPRGAFRRSHSGSRAGGGERAVEGTAGAGVQS